MESRCLSVKCLEPQRGCQVPTWPRELWNKTRFLFLGLQSRSVFVPQEGGSWKPRKSWTLEFKVNLATLLSRDFGQDSPAL